MGKNTPNPNDSATRANLDAKIPYSNFHFADIFGRFHRFFRPFCYTFRALRVYVFNGAYFYSDSSEVVITRSKKALISQSSYPCHEFDKPQATKGALKEAFFALKQCIKWARFHAQKAQYIDGTVAILHQSTNYFHFLTESMASYLQIRAFAEATNTNIDFYTLDSSAPFQAQMWEILGIPKERILPPKPRKLYFAKNLILPTLTANTETVEYRSRILWSRAFSLPLFLRDFYDNFTTQNLSLPRTTPFRKIFLTRPKNSNRNITNLAEVEAIFAHFGYEIILPDSLSFRDQARMSSEAKILASMHGAGLANALFMQENACVLELFSASYFDPSAQTCALLKHLKYFYFVGETNNTSCHPQVEGAYFAKKSLESALARIEAFL